MIRMVVSLLLFAAEVSAASAQGPYTPLQVGNWAGGTYTDDKTNRFSHCAASVDFDEGGGTLFVWVNKDFSWSIGVYRTSLNFKVGSWVTVGLSMDNVGTYNLQGEVRREHFFIVKMPGDDATIEAFQAAQYLYVQTPNEHFSYSLTSTRQLIPELQNCVQAHQDDYATSENSRVEKSPVAPSPPPNDRDTQAAREKVTKGVAEEYNNCMIANTKELVPYSNESAEVIAQVIITKCQGIQTHFVDLAMAIYGISKPEAEKVIAASVEERKKSLVADIVTFRAEVNKTLSQQRKSSASGAQTPAGQGL